MVKGKKIIKETTSPYLLFSPFLVLLIAYVLIFPTNGHQGDEARYLMFANNLSHGFYSPPPPFINLTNGPGYPIILVPFIALGLPLICITLMNAFFYYLSIIFLFKTLKQIVSFRATLIFSFFWACYYIAYQNITFILTETFTYFLVSGLILSLVVAFKSEDHKKKKKYILLSGFLIGYIVLTKVAFGYVLLFMLAGSVLLWTFNRQVVNYRKALFIMLISLGTVAPYMIYTYHLTGRIFYWSTTAGNTLYWASTPYENEYGDFKLTLEQEAVDMGNYNIPGSGDSLKAHHQKDFDEIYQYRGLEQDDAFKRIAINNIKSHPLKYFKNCIYNVGRLIFHYPFSQAVERPKILLVFPLNGIVFTLILFCLIPTFKNWQKIIFPIRFMLLFTLLYLGVSILVTAYVRMFSVIVPILMVWFAYIFQKSVKINMRFFENKKE